MTQFSTFLTFLSDFLISFGYVQPIDPSNVIKSSLYLSRTERGNNYINPKKTMDTLYLV